VSRASDGRAQLILAAAVVIAAVIVGLTLLVNSILFTETLGSEGVNSRLETAKSADFEVRKGVRSSILRVNHAGRNVTEPEARERVRRNVTVYSRLLAEANAVSRPFASNVSYHDPDTELGLRIVQDEDSNMSDVNEVATWQPLPTPDRRVGWFTMNVNLANSSIDPFRVVATNTSGGTLTLRFNRTTNGTLEVNETGSFLAAERSTKCDPSSGRVLLDVYAGTSFTGDCAFNGTDVLSGPDNTDLYDLRFVDGDNLNGKFGLVMNGSWTSPPPGVVAHAPVCDGNGPDQADPCRMPIVWSANVTTTVVAEGLTYDNQYNISAYARNR
jgi:hypothetical protein